MSEQYARLVAAWREADAAVKSAQDALDVQLEKFINEDGPVPTEAERAHVGQLRRIAGDRLAEVLRYLAQGDRAPGADPPA